MKYTIEGFSQEQALKIGLSVEDLVVLRWFVDFFNSDNMVKFHCNGKSYAWVSYQGFMEQMPIVSCTKRTVAAKFRRLVNANVLINQTIKKGGTFSAYGFGPAYSMLVEGTTTVAEKTTTVTQKAVTGLQEKRQPGCSKNSNQNTSLLETNLLEDYSISPKAPSKGAKKDWPGFDAFYAAYPRHTGKAAALRAWNKLEPDQELQQQMLEALKKQKRLPQWADDNGRFIPHPATWLNGHRWEDETEVKQIEDKPAGQYAHIGITV